jgi:hypothetical protein
MGRRGVMRSVCHDSREAGSGAADGFVARPATHPRRPAFPLTPPPVRRILRLDLETPSGSRGGQGQRGSGGPRGGREAVRRVPPQNQIPFTLKVSCRASALTTAGIAGSRSGRSILAPNLFGSIYLMPLRFLPFNGFPAPEASAGPHPSMGRSSRRPASRPLGKGLKEADCQAGGRLYGEQGHSEIAGNVRSGGR